MLFRSRSLVLVILAAATLGSSGCAYYKRELQTDKALAEQRAMQLLQDMEAMREEKQDLELQRRTVEVALEEKTRALTLAETELKSTKDKLSAAQLALSQSSNSQTNQLASHITQSLESEQELKTQIEKLNDQVSSLQVQILKEEEEKTQLREELEWLRKDAEALEAEAIGLRELTEEQKTEIANLTTAQQAGSSQQRDVEKRLTALTAEVAEKESARKKLEEELTASKSQQKTTASPERIAEAQKLAEGRLTAQVKAGNARVIAEAGRLRIVLMTDTLFNPGTTQLSEAGIRTLTAAHEVLATAKPGMLIIEGHTDSVPVKNLPYPSNWELAAARATEVARWLAAKPEMDPKNIAAQSRAYFVPLGDNATDAGRRVNRRVELIMDSQPR